VADTQSLTSAEDYSLADSGHGLSEDSDHGRLSLSTFRPKLKPPTARVQQSDVTGLSIVQTAQRRAADKAAGVGLTPLTSARTSYGNNLASGWTNSDKLSRYKSWQPPTSSATSLGESSPSTTQLKRTAAPTVRTAGRGAERSLKKNNEQHNGDVTSKNYVHHTPATSSSLPPLPPNNLDVQRSTRALPSPQLLRRAATAAAAEHNLSPVASSTDANASDVESSTSGSFLMLGPHGTSRLACVSEL